MCPNYVTIIDDNTCLEVREMVDRVVELNIHEVETAGEGGGDADVNSIGGRGRQGEEEGVMTDTVPSVGGWLETPGNSEADILLNLSMTDGLVRSGATKDGCDILDTLCTSKEQSLDLMTPEKGGDDILQKRGGPDDTLARSLVNTVAKGRGKRAFLAQQGDCFTLGTDDLMTGGGGS